MGIRRRAWAEYWGALDATYALCESGTRQSPIDITEADITEATEAAPAAVGFDYGAIPVDVLNNGHTIQVAADGAIQASGRRYRLMQLHFHTPSEESIAGHRYDTVAHLVHRDEAGALAVVAVLFEKGEENLALAPVWRNIPAIAGERRTVPGASLDLNALLPQKRSFFLYDGSLTTPPCSEGVTWIVLKEPVPVSQAQLEAFRQIYPHNARPLQPANGRRILTRG